MKYSKVAIIGPGLLGGSLLMALKNRNLADQVSVWARREESCRNVLEKNLAQVASTELSKVVRDAEAIILCTPIGIMPRLAQEMIPYVSKDTIVTDVGSVKHFVETQLAPIFKGKAAWIGSHPMAGSEQSGIDAARENLFVDATVILTPTPETVPNAASRAQKFWEQVGGRTLSFSPEIHDRMVAQISHLPHLVASLLVNSTKKESFQVAGPGFRDTTRVAAGHGEMWSEILLSNRDAVLESLNTFLTQAETVRKILENDQEEELKELLTKAGEVRKLLTFKNHE